MIQRCGFFVIRLDGKVIKIEGLYDPLYTTISMYLKSEYLSDDDLKIIFKPWQSDMNKRIESVRKDGVLWFQEEVRWCCFDLSRYKTEIIYKDIEIN